MTQLVTTLKRLRDGGESTLGWINVIEDMIELVKDRIPSPLESHTWAALTHFFHAVCHGDEGVCHLRSIGLQRYQKRLAAVCRSNEMKLRVHPTKREWGTFSPSFTFIDLFAGVGGFHLALAANGGRPVFVSEWDDAARITYARNFGIIPYGDIRHFTIGTNGSPMPKKELQKHIPRCDIVSAGFPCQPFSLAGVSSRNYHGHAHGLACITQGTLFEDLVQIASASNARAVLLENVKNLASHDNGRTLPVILDRLREHGFQIFPEAPESGRVPPGWALQDSSEVSAQRRKRLYFVGIKSGSDHSSFKFPELKPLPNTPLTIGEVIRADRSMTDQEKFRVYGISRKLWNSHRSRDAKHAVLGHGFHTNLISDRNTKAPTLVARYYKDGKDCLIARLKDPKALHGEPRMLTPRECAILQTFPDDFILPDAKTPAYRQMGNAITVEVARQICKSLVGHLSTEA